MNEFNSNLPKTPTEIGTPKPFNSPETIIHNPELLGNDQVEVGHELGLESGHEVDDMIKEAQNLAAITTETTGEIPQVELPAELTPQVSKPEEQTPIMLEKKSKAPLFKGAAAGLAVLLGGLGISAVFSGKKPEMGMTDQAPKVEQANTATTENTLKVPSIETPKAPVVETPSRMSGAVMQSEPTMKQTPNQSEYEPSQAEIQNLLDEEVPRDEAIKRLKAEHTRIEGAKANNAKVFGQPKGWDQAAENKAQDEARAMEKVNQINDIGNQPADYSKLTGNTEQTFGGFKVNDQTSHSKEEMKEYMIKNAREMGSSEADIAKAIKDFDTAYSNSGLK
jgi:hypothetical protein